jgi:hypothetical protein
MADHPYQDPVGDADGVLLEEIGHFGCSAQEVEDIGYPWANHPNNATSELLGPFPVPVQTNQSSTVDHINSRELPYLNLPFPYGESTTENSLSNVTESESFNFAFVPNRPSLWTIPLVDRWDSRLSYPPLSIGVETDLLALQTLPPQLKTSRVKPRRQRRNKMPVMLGPNRYGRMGTTRCLQCRKWRQKASHLTPVLTLVSVQL